MTGTLGDVTIDSDWAKVKTPPRVGGTPGMLRERTGNVSVQKTQMIRKGKSYVCVRRQKVSFFLGDRTEVGEVYAQVKLRIGILSLREVSDRDK